jgi:acrylyl-CoA reductase (NADPH)
MPTFKAVFAEQIEGKPHISIRQIDRASLPPGEVLVQVHYSDLNYKDGLAVTGRPGVIRKYPMIPGVDLAGVVEESSSPDWKPGDEVVVTGFGLSETAWGGYAELARVNADWLVRPSALGPLMPPVHNMLRRFQAKRESNEALSFR